MAPLVPDYLLPHVPRPSDPLDVKSWVDLHQWLFRSVLQVLTAYAITSAPSNNERCQSSLRHLNPQCSAFWGKTKRGSSRSTRPSGPGTAPLNLLSSAILSAPGCRHSYCRRDPQVTERAHCRRTFHVDSTAQGCMLYIPAARLRLSRVTAMQSKFVSCSVVDAAR